MSGLRVAHVVCTEAFAGVERHVTTLAGGLAQSGCDVTVIGGQGSLMRPTLQEAGATWIPGARPFDALAALLRHRCFDVIHAHMTAAELATVLAGVVVRSPVVATRHFARHRGSNPPVRLIGRVIATRLAVQVAVSEYVARTTENPTVVIPLGTNPSADAPGSAGRRPVVLVAQRLEPEKRTDLALEAWQRCGLADFGWRLLVAGEGSERPRLEKLAARLEIKDSCRFLGLRSDIGRLQRQASILLAPCAIESFGLSVVEAMALALPVVAAAGGGHMETVGVTPGAALYPPGDTAAAGRMLRELATDPPRRDAYGGALRSVHADRFSLDRQVSKTLDVYRSVVR